MVSNCDSRENAALRAAIPDPGDDYEEHPQGDAECRHRAGTYTHVISRLEGHADRWRVVGVGLAYLLIIIDIVVLAPDRILQANLIGEAGILLLVVLLLVRAHREGHWILGVLSIVPWLTLSTYHLIEWQPHQYVLGWGIFLSAVLFFVVGMKLKLYWRS